MRRLHLTIATPCAESFARMHGDERARFCEKCRKSVHDLSTRTEQEARALLHEHAGQGLCVRYATDKRGRVVFKTALVAAAISVAACGAGTSELPANAGASPAAKCARANAAAARDAGAADDQQLLMGDVTFTPDE